MPTDALSNAALLGETPASQQIHLAISLPLRNQGKLTDLLHRLYNPADPLYGQYLKPSEFAASFGPTQADYDAVKAFAKAQALTITATYTSRALLDVKGSAAAVDAAFGIHLRTYQAQDGHSFFAPDTDPTLPDALVGKVIDVAGLTDAYHEQPQLTGSRELLPYAAPFGLSLSNMGRKATSVPGPIPISFQAICSPLTISRLKTELLRPAPAKRSRCMSLAAATPKAT